MKDETGKISCNYLTDDRSGLHSFTGLVIGEEVQPLFFHRNFIIVKISNGSKIKISVQNSIRNSDPGDLKIMTSI